MTNENPFRKGPRRVRALRITPKGYEILRLVALGKYRFAPSRGKRTKETP